MKRSFSQALVLLLFWTSLVGAREWTDASGKYHIDGELFARSDTMVVLEKKNKSKDLVAIAIDQLSEKDRKYLEAKQEEAEGASDRAMQTWTTRNGLKIRGSVVEYTRRDITIRRRRGKVYVNDKRFDNLPGIYRRMLPLIVARFEDENLADEKDLRNWVKKLGGGSKKYTCDGVLLELENGDLYVVPFFFFSEADLKILEPGWDAWVKAHQSKEEQEQYSLSLRAEAMANRRDDAERRQVAMLSLQLQGYQAGLFDLWEVALFPPQNVGGMPLSVVVPARNSQRARAAALEKYPNYRVGPVGKARRRY